MAADYNVDFHSRAFNGEKFLKLMVLGLLQDRQQSQKRLSRIYGSELFMQLNGLTHAPSATHQSISLRLRNTPSEYFRDCYDYLLKRYDGLLEPPVAGGARLVAVDSTMVREMTAKLKAGMVTGRPSADGGRRRQVKYTMAYDGMAASIAQLHTSQSYLDEDKALKEAIEENCRKREGHRDLYVFDRGVKGGAVLTGFAREDIRFVGRFNGRRRVEALRDSAAPVGELPNGAALVSDRIVRIYGKGDTHTPIATPLRLVIVDMGRPIGARPGRNRRETTLCIITDEMELTVEQLLEIYRFRWRIEVFFKFLKSNLSFSHMLSVDQNGLTSVLWLTLITALLLKVYALANHRTVSNSVFYFAIDLVDDLLVSARQASSSPEMQCAVLQDIGVQHHAVKE